jgi:hypothetical protein
MPQTCPGGCFSLILRYLELKAYGLNLVSEDKSSAIYNCEEREAQHLNS